MSLLEDTFRGWIRDAIQSELRDLPDQLQELVSKSKSTDLPTFLTADEVAELAKVRPQTVRSWVSSGALPAHYAGRKLRIRLDELETFMQREKDEALPSTADDDDRVREILASINE